LLNELYVVGLALLEKLEGDIPIQTCVVGLEDHSHASLPGNIDDLIMVDLAADRKTLAASGACNDFEGFALRDINQCLAVRTGLKRRPERKIGVGISRVLVDVDVLGVREGCHRSCLG
jgi:hypothetical protein